MTSELADGLDLGENRDDGEAFEGPKVCSMDARPVASVYASSGRSYDIALGRNRGQGGGGVKRQMGRVLNQDALVGCSSPIKRVFWLQWARQVLKRRDGEEC